MKGNIFYIKDRRLFSKQREEIEVFDFGGLDKVSYDSDDFASCNSCIIKVLDEIVLNPKKISFYGLISDFENVCSEVERMWKKGKKKFIKVKDDDYTFAEVTSSVEILDAFESQLKEDDKSMQISQKRLREYVDSVKESEQRKVEGLDLEINNLESERKRVVNEKESFYDDFVKPLDSSLSENEKSLEELQRERDDLGKEGSMEDSGSLAKNRVRDLSLEKKEISSKFESLEFDVKVLKERINILNRKKKLGVRRVPNVSLMFLTLGLIYWTKFSDIDYRINVLHIKIAKRKEKILKVGVLVSRKEKEIDELMKSIKEFDANKSKEVKEKKEKARELDKKIREFKTGIDTIVKEIDSLRDNLRSFDKKIEEIDFKVGEVKHAKDKVSENSSSVILDKFRCVNEKQRSSLKKIKEAKERLKQQRVKIPRDCVLSFNSQSLRGEK